MNVQENKSQRTQSNGSLILPIIFPNAESSDTFPSRKIAAPTCRVCVPAEFDTIRVSIIDNH